MLATLIRHPIADLMSLLLLVAWFKLALDNGWIAVYVRFLIRLFPILSYDYRNRRVKQKQICPACGNRSKIEMRYHPHEKQVVCGCPICFASWGYNPIVKTEKW